MIYSYVVALLPSGHTPLKQRRFNVTLNRRCFNVVCRQLVESTLCAHWIDIAKSDTNFLHAPSEKYLWPY